MLQEVAAGGEVMEGATTHHLLTPTAHHPNHERHLTRRVPLRQEHHKITHGGLVSGRALSAARRGDIGLDAASVSESTRNGTDPPQDPAGLVVAAEGNRVGIMPTPEWGAREVLQRVFQRAIMRALALGAQGGDDGIAPLGEAVVQEET